MPSKKTICIVIGTRPEAIKMAPVISALRKRDWANVKIIGSGQHRELLNQVLDHFGLETDIDLDVMTHNQSLAGLTSKLISELDGVLKKLRPDAVLAQGDTTTVMTAALVAFYNRIPFGHVEAGLRTNDINNPYPEEANRVIVGHLATWHFAPTVAAHDCLINAGVLETNAIVTGNTVIDALKWTVTRAPKIELEVAADKRLVLITCHRRENFGGPFLQICAAIKQLAEEFPDTLFLYPVHPNPNIHDVAHRELGSVTNIFLSKPLGYPSFVGALQRAYIVISDSGGVQEEAPALGKPVLVLREETERPEAVAAGVVKLVGTETSRIVSETRTLLNDKSAWKAMSKDISPYGDGHASTRIADFLQQRLN